MHTRILTGVQLIPVGISLLLIAAHFFRYNQLAMVGSCLGLACGLLVCHPLAARVIQSALILATVEWLRTAYVLITARMAEGYPWTRLAIILGSVALLTLSSVFVFRFKLLRQRYRL